MSNVKNKKYKTKSENNLPFTPSFIEITTVRLAFLAHVSTQHICIFKQFVKFNSCANFLSNAKHSFVLTD